MNYKQQLDELLKVLSQSELASLLGVTERSIQNYLSEEKPTTPHQKTLRKIAEIYTKLIIEGKRLNEINDPVIPYQQQRFEQKTNSENEYLVPFVDVPAQAGNAIAYHQRDYIASLKKYPILPDVDPTGLTWRYFLVDGESMEPEIMKGDVLLCSLVNKEDWQTQKNYHTHVIVTDENLWIKDIFRENENEWILLSQNETSKPFVVPVQDIRQVWVMRRHIKNRAKKHRMYDIDAIKRELSSARTHRSSPVNPDPFQRIRVGGVRKKK